MVRDTGIGISDELRGKLFTPFQQADSSSTRKYGGTGLGLVISKSIVEAMGGEITFESTEGKGSVFSLTLPFAIAKNITDDWIQPDYSLFSGKKIMVVDDNSTNREIVKTYLLEAGCQVIEADSALAAMGRFINNNNGYYSAVLIDYQMPGMNGYDLAQAMQAIPEIAAIPRILLTSAAQRGAAKNAKERGFAGYLSKPFRKSELLDCVSIVLASDAINAVEDEFMVTRYTAKRPIVKNDLRILLAEDNEVNRKFFVRLLKGRGLDCDVAINGLEAVTAWQKNGYDLIFMDCQMPGMDGYEATRQIRELEAGAKHTPIVAMTAFAMQGDAEKCLAAGMDEYLSKPVDVDKLGKIIRKYSGNPGSYYDQVLERLIKNAGFDQTSARELLDEGIPLVEATLDDIEARLADRQLEEVDRLLHQFKGATGNLRMSEIAETAKAAEVAAKAGGMMELKARLAEIKTQLKLL